MINADNNTEYVMTESLSESLWCVDSTERAEQQQHNQIPSWSPDTVMVLQLMILLRLMRLKKQ